MKVFLGGTCAESKWREYLIPKLKCDYFNPVVPDWTPECQAREEEEKKICSHHLYVITPKMKGVFSIAEAVYDALNLPMGGCVFCVTKEEDDRDWTKGELKSLDATAKLINDNGGVVLNSLDEVAEYLNQFSYESIVEEKDMYKSKFDYVLENWKLLRDAILPKDWYSPYINDWQSGIEVATAECLIRLRDKKIQNRLKNG